MRLMVVGMLVVALGCSTTASKPPPPRPQTIAVVKAFADRACNCGTDRDCVQPIRDEFDAQKQELLANGLTGNDKTRFDTELSRLVACGDAAGLTIWLK